MSTYESLRAQIEAHEAEEARLLAEIDALRARAEAAEQRAETTRPVRPTRAQERASLPQDTATLSAWWNKNGVWRGEEGEVRALAQRIAAERGVKPRGDGYRVDGSLREFAGAWVAEQTDETLLQLLAWPRSR